MLSHSHVYSHVYSHSHSHENTLHKRGLCTVAVVGVCRTESVTHASPTVTHERDQRNDSVWAALKKVPRMGAASHFLAVHSGGGTTRLAVEAPCGMFSQRPLAFALALSLSLAPRNLSRP